MMDVKEAREKLAELLGRDAVEEFDEDAEWVGNQFFKDRTDYVMFSLVNLLENEDKIVILQSLFTAGVMSYRKFLQSRDHDLRQLEGRE